MNGSQEKKSKIANTNQKIICISNSYLDSIYTYRNIQQIWEWWHFLPVYYVVITCQRHLSLGILLLKKPSGGTTCCENSEKSQICKCAWIKIMIK